MPILIELIGGPVDSFMVTLPTEAIPSKIRVPIDRAEAEIRKIEPGEAFDSGLGSAEYYRTFWKRRNDQTGEVVLLFASVDTQEEYWLNWTPPEPPPKL